MQALAQAEMMSFHCKVPAFRWGCQTVKKEAYSGTRFWDLSVEIKCQSFFGCFLMRCFGAVVRISSIAINTGHPEKGEAATLKTLGITVMSPHLSKRVTVLSQTELLSLNASGWSCASSSMCFFWRTSLFCVVYCFVSFRTASLPTLGSGALGQSSGMAP